MSDVERIPAVFGLATELAIARGAKSIKDLPGCFEMEIDARWWCAFNGNGTPTKCSRGPEVTPYGIYFERNGWPCGIVNAAGGTIAGYEGTEDELCDALKAAASLTQTGEEKGDG